MPAVLIALFLLAPGPKTQWSEKHGVGVRIPDSWTVVARDKGAQAFVVEGPRLGPGIPRLVLWEAGPADDLSLDRFAAALKKQVLERPGWQATATQRKRIGVFPCVRLGLRFEEGGRPGRARVTAALLGGRFFVLELSAAASHFPAALFDRIEGSLVVRWSEQRLEGGLVVRAPDGWAVERTGSGLVLRGPRLGAGAAMVALEREDGGLQGPPGAEPGPKMLFLGLERESLQAEQGDPPRALRLRLTHAGGWTGAIVMPVSNWEDLYPVAEAILKSARLDAGGD